MKFERLPVRALSGAIARSGMAAALACLGAIAAAGEFRFPGNDPRFDLKTPILWSATCELPDGTGLAYGGQDQKAEDGQGHTRIREGGNWKPIHEELRVKNPLQRFHDRLWASRDRVKNGMARARIVYFKGLAPVEEVARLKAEAIPELDKARQDLAGLAGELEKTAGLEAYEAGQAKASLALLQPSVARLQGTLAALSGGVMAELLKQLYAAQVDLERAAAPLDAEPGPRALSAIAYDPKTRLFVLFGGDHLDYLTNDTWVFDPVKCKWLRRTPAAAPPPREFHVLEPAGDGKIRLSGGVTYTSDMVYLSPQYKELNDGEWLYDLSTDAWTGGGKLEQETRTYRSDAYHPDYYLQGPKPRAAEFEARLKALPANEWMTTDPPYRCKPRRDWGTAVIDTGRDLLLRWAGGHDDYDGTEVTHFHFSTNRWEFPYPSEFPPGYVYVSGPRPQGYNFNRRPWMTGHTYLNWAYDGLSQKMVQTGHRSFFFVYDPAVADWCGRGFKPEGMNYYDCLYTLVLTATPQGVVCWTKDGRFFLFNGAKNEWSELKTSGDKAVGAVTDGSASAYDSKRDRVLFLSAEGYQKPFKGQLYSLELKTGAVKALAPSNLAAGEKIARTDRCCYDTDHDLLLLATFVKGTESQLRTVAYDCAGNRWVHLGLKYKSTKEWNGPQAQVPYGYNAGILFDSHRHLIWGTNMQGQVFVLRLDPQTADVKPLE